MSAASPAYTVYLGALYTPLAAGGWDYILDGALVVDLTGRIVARATRAEITGAFPCSRVIDHTGRLILPGFVDCHQHVCHYEWVQSVPDLFEWLQKIYALEAQFADTEYARRVAKEFFGELVRNGTTTCCVHGPYFRDATEVAFEEATGSQMRVLMGMNMGDTDLPAELSRPPEECLRCADELHTAWSGRNKGLIGYVYTVRPAYCSSGKLLRGVGERAQLAGVRVQCHLGETAGGRRRIARRFRGVNSESAAYDACGLLTTQTLMAHGVYIADDERELLSQRGVSIAHCPRANLLAGGAQMPLRKFLASGITVGLGTDLGGGKGLSLFRTMEDALKVTPDLSVHELFRHATLEGAEALRLGAVTGSLEVGKDADFLVVRARGTQPKPELEEILSSLVFRGDDRDIQSAYVRGRSLLAAEG